jgi:hypothetical protein
MTPRWNEESAERLGQAHSRIESIKGHRIGGCGEPLCVVPPVPAAVPPCVRLRRARPAAVPLSELAGYLKLAALGQHGSVGIGELLRIIGARSSNGRWCAVVLGRSQAGSIAVGSKPGAEARDRLGRAIGEIEQPAQRCWFTARATVASRRTRWLPQRLGSTLRCSVLVCLRCGASHAETLPRGRAIDA